MKQFARFCAALVVLVLVFSLCTVAYADGSVTYNGDADQFIFAPGSSQSPTNLFGNFQNVMPGDTLTDQILVRNNTVSRIKHRVEPVLMSDFLIIPRFESQCAQWW